MIKARKDIPSGTLVLNNSERHNPLSRLAIQELQQALEDFQQERNVRAVILMGSGDTFCSGSDLSEISESSESPDSMSHWYEDATQYRELLETMLRFPKPIIAAVNGPVYGNGVGLILASDLVVASETAILGLPEPRLGLVASQVAPLLTFRVGGSYASRLLVTGSPVDAQMAQHMGLYHEVVKNDLVWARANELAIECAKNAPEAIQLTKKMLYETIGESLATWHSIGAANAATARTTEAAKEGIKAFFEKRTPEWF